MTKLNNDYKRLLPAKSEWPRNRVLALGTIHDVVRGLRGNGHLANGNPEELASLLESAGRVLQAMLDHAEVLHKAIEDM